MVNLAKMGRFSIGGFSGSLTKGNLPNKGIGGVFATLITILLGFFFGGVAGNGVRTVAKSIPVLGTLPWVPEVLGGLAGFATGGLAGVAGYATTAGLVPRIGSR
jgi:hypothetical protein